MTIATTALPAAGQTNNPLLQDWKTPHQTPPFSNPAATPPMIFEKQMPVSESLPTNHIQINADTV